MIRNFIIISPPPRTRIPGKGEASGGARVCGEIAQFTLDVDDNVRPKEGSGPVFIPVWHFFSFCLVIVGERYHAFAFWGLPIPFYRHCAVILVMAKFYLWFHRRKGHTFPLLYSG